MTLAQKLAALASFAEQAREINEYEAFRRFRAHSMRCALDAEWQKLIIAIEVESAPLEALPARIVRESRVQLEALHEAIKRTIDDASLALVRREGNT